jgi:hypothetical protein
MEPLTSIKKSQLRAAEIEAAVAAFTLRPPELDLPVDPDFNPEPLHLDPVKMYWRCEELVRQGARRHNHERRLAESIDVEFVI